MSSDVLVTLRCCSYSPFVLSLSKDVLTVPPAPKKTPAKPATPTLARRSQKNAFLHTPESPIIP